MLNWRPVVDYELREIEFDRREIEYKRRMQQLQIESEQLKIEEQQRSIAHEQKMKQLDDEDAAFNARMQSLDAKLAALWPSSNSSTSQTQPPESDSVTSSP